MNPMVIAQAVLDCERIHPGWPAQPVNAYSSVAFLLVGLWFLARGRAVVGRVYGASVALVGVGSLVFHGRFGQLSGWLHDVSIIWLLLIVFGLEGYRVATAVAMAASAVLIWAAPGSDEPLGLALAAVVVMREVTDRRARHRRWLAAAGPLFAAAVLLNVLGRTGASWCDPESILQPHAGWHVLAAAGLLAYGSARGWLRRSLGAAS